MRTESTGSTGSTEHGTPAAGPRIYGGIIKQLTRPKLVPHKFLQLGSWIAACVTFHSAYYITQELDTGVRVGDAMLLLF